MNINDEMLSAYLDDELSDQDRALVRTALGADAKAADRLAQLASVNALVGRQATLVDQLPMPQSVLSLLREDKHVVADNVVELSGFRQARQRVMHVMREHAALAASLALLIGFASGQLLPLLGNNPENSHTDSSPAIYAALDIVPSGQQLSIDDNTSVTARFSFLDTQSRLCRQFVVQDTQGSSENLACRDKDQWTLVATARSSAVANSAQYQPASGPRLLDNILDAMMQGSALSQAEEQSAISNRWQSE
ncbi:MAG: zf-HC2 domain-containing protein [Pseudohongiella sp.]|nr:zf-HC2 domain-containing protein [Pseudohongiella sp.]